MTNEHQTQTTDETPKKEIRKLERISNSLFRLTTINTEQKLTSVKDYSNEELKNIYLAINDSLRSQEKEFANLEKDMLALSKLTSIPATVLANRDAICRYLQISQEELEETFKFQRILEIHNNANKLNQMLERAKVAKEYVADLEKQKGEILHAFPEANRVDPNKKRK